MKKRKVLFLFIKYPGKRWACKPRECLADPEPLKNSAIYDGTQDDLHVVAKKETKHMAPTACRVRR